MDQIFSFLTEAAFSWGWGCSPLHILKRNLSMCCNQRNHKRGGISTEPKPQIWGCVVFAQVWACLADFHSMRAICQIVLFGLFPWASSCLGGFLDLEGSCLPFAALRGCMNVSDLDISVSWHPEIRHSQNLQKSHAKSHGTLGRKEWRKLSQHHASADWIHDCSKNVLVSPLSRNMQQDLSDRERWIPEKVPHYCHSFSVVDPWEGHFWKREYSGHTEGIVIQEVLWTSPLCMLVDVLAVPKPDIRNCSESVSGVLPYFHLKIPSRAVLMVAPNPDKRSCDGVLELLDMSTYKASKLEIRERCDDLATGSWGTIGNRISRQRSQHWGSVRGGGKESSFRRPWISERRMSGTSRPFPRLSWTAISLGPRKWRERRREPELPDLAWKSQTSFSQTSIRDHPRFIRGQEGRGTLRVV